MGSEGTDMGKRAETSSEGDGTDPQASPKQRPNTCCFCWCCCCSCPCLSARKEEREETAGRPTEETKMETTVETIESNEESNPLPSLEEITSWTQGFDKVMRTEAGRNIFREFLRTEYSEENMLFWLACEDFKKEKNSKVVAERARTIYEDYISILSPREVSLDSRVREIVNRNLLNPCPLMFEDAQLQIYSLMHRDSFPRFLNSEIYKSLIERPKTSPDTSPSAESKARTS
ncbi:regulator of G-protein signaling 17 isoform X2 [Rhincodon typus]|uniref:regulator of G-protein signaling 17 isoform X2 n=1 Tax=Rhincodon typus TaxID=259920 RepID=UPI00202DE678|nr:regulator of G-protein signaling 17 isoform X2 [Rhincodon typus]